MTAATAYAAHVRATSEGVSEQLIRQDLDTLDRMGRLLSECARLIATEARKLNYTSGRPRAFELLACWGDDMADAFGADAAAVIMDSVRVGL